MLAEVTAQGPGDSGVLSGSCGHYWVCGLHLSHSHGHSGVLSARLWPLLGLWPAPQQQPRLHTLAPYSDLQNSTTSDI